MTVRLPRRTPTGEPRFRLEVEREPSGGLAVVALERQVQRRHGALAIRFVPVARGRGLGLEVALPLLAAAVRENGTSPERLARPGRPSDPPIELDEGSGARVALALVAVAPLRKLERMQAVVRGIAEMSNEEALYWFARAMRGPRARTLRALRILLAKE